MKLNITVNTPKPRNPVAVAAHQRTAGAHRRSASGLRQRANREMRHDMRRELQYLRSSP